MCVESVKNLSTFRPIGRIVALAEIDNKFSEKIERMGSWNHFHFIHGQREIWPLFRKVALMVRPTFNEGHGISIEKVLYFGCPAVASNVCQRPNGTILFEKQRFGRFHLKMSKSTEK